MRTALILLDLAALAGLGLLAWRWSRAIGEGVRGLETLGKGQRTRPILVEMRGPVGRLVDSFNDAAPQTQLRIEQLERDREQLRVVLGAMAEAVIAVDSRRRLLFANTSADVLFGLDTNSVGRLVPEL